MGYEGNNLQADVEAVWTSAVKIFPKMAGCYQTANAAVHSTHYATDEHSKFFPSWQNLRDEFEVILGSEATCMEATAKAICAVMTDYASTDAAAKRALDKVRQQLPDAPPEIPDTYTPWAYRAAPVEYDDIKVEGATSKYSGNAPSVADLIAKGKVVDDKLLEAAKVEADALESVILFLTPDSWVEDAARDAGWEYIEDKMGTTAKLEPGVHQFAITSLQQTGGNSVGGGVFNQLSTENSNASDALNPAIWDSEAAREFRSQHLNAYQDITDNQELILATLGNALDDFQTALESTYQKYDEAMDSAITSLDAIIQGGEGKWDDITTNILTATIAVAGVAATGGTGMGFTLVSGGVSIAAATAKVGGAESGEVHRTLLDGIGTVKGTLDDFDTELKSKLTKFWQAVYDKKSVVTERIMHPPVSAFSEPGAEL